MYKYAFVNNENLLKKYKNQLNSYEVIIDNRVSEDHVVFGNSIKLIDLAYAIKNA